jgi:uncharacterized membrane protein
MSSNYRAGQDHRRPRKAICLFATVAICFASEVQSKAAIPAYRVFDLTSQFADGDVVIPADINDLNQVVGQALTSGGGQGFFYSDGTVTLLDPLPDSLNAYSTASAVNTLGQIVGYSDEEGIPKAAYWASAADVPASLETGGGPDANVYATNINDNTIITGFFTSSGGGGVSNWTAVKWEPDSGHPDRFDFTKLLAPVIPPPGVPAGAFGINAAGEIVGSGAIDPALPFEGALRWSPAGQVAPLDTLEGPLTHYFTALAINSSSVAVGRYRTTTGAEFPLKWEADGSIVTLGVPEGFTEATAFDINNDGLIVGQARAAANRIALIYADGAWIDLNSRVLNGGGWHLEAAVAINNHGAIVGTGTLNGAARAFLLSPALPGDFNNDGAVDAADYVVWRKSGGAPEKYAMWRSRFGLTDISGAHAGGNAAVPEPATVIVLLAVAGWFLRRRHQTCTIQIDQYHPCHEG